MTIQEAVNKILVRDEVAFNALKKGILNTNAYSKIISPKINKLLRKKVKVNSISVALGRIRKQINKLGIGLSKIHIKSLHIDSPVVLYTFNKDDVSLVGILNLVLDKKVQKFLIDLSTTDNDIILVTSRDIPALQANEWQKFLKIKKDNLASIRIRVISDSLDETHDILQELLIRLRDKGINIYFSVNSMFDISIVVDNDNIPKVVRFLV